MKQIILKDWKLNQKIIEIESHFSVGGLRQGASDS